MAIGTPYMAIYSYELYHVYYVDNIIRIGTAWLLVKDIQMRDLIVAKGASTDTNYDSNLG